MKVTFISLLTVFFLCVSCERKAIIEDASYADTLVSPLPIGIYSGTLPCPNCKGISYDVKLNADYQYISKQQYMGRSEKIITKTGIWFMLSDTILKLDAKRKSDDRYFSVRKNALRSLDKEGNWFATPEEERYILRKQSIADTVRLQ